MARHAALVDARGVGVRSSMTAMTFDIGPHARDRDWGPGDEVVVSRLDHDTNPALGPRPPSASTPRVRWIGFDPVTAELTTSGPLLDRPHAGVVARRPRPPTSSAPRPRPGPPSRARGGEVGASCTSTQSHLAAHVPVGLGGDGRRTCWRCSPSCSSDPTGDGTTGPGPQGRLDPTSSLPSSDAGAGALRDFGTLPYELLAGVKAAGSSPRSAAWLPSWRTSEQLWTACSRLRPRAGSPCTAVAARRTPTVLVHGGRPRRASRWASGARGRRVARGSLYTLAACPARRLVEPRCRASASRPTRRRRVDRLLAAMERVLRT